jgi:hypothetical protein
MGKATGLPSKAEGRDIDVMRCCVSSGPVVQPSIAFYPQESPLS